MATAATGRNNSSVDVASQDVRWGPALPGCSTFLTRQPSFVSAHSDEWQPLHRQQHQPSEQHQQLPDASTQTQLPLPHSIRPTVTHTQRVDGKPSLSPSASRNAGQNSSLSSIVHYPLVVKEIEPTEDVGHELAITNSNEETLSPPTKKRRRQESSSSSKVPYSRKRALVACQLCRRRKAKCDNQRPSCGFCKQHDADCVYQDGKSDYSSFDSASLAILDRLNYVVNILEKHDRDRSPRTSLERSDSDLLPPFELSTLKNDIIHHQRTHPTRSPATLVSENSIFPAAHSDSTGLIESMEVAAEYRGSCEDVIEWPIFEGRYNRRDIEQLIFNPSGEEDDYEKHNVGSPMVGDDNAALTATDPRRSANRGKGIREEDVVALAQTFLANVHTKNPVLDAGDTILMAHSVAEHGFGWNVQTCLVLIVSALGTISSPFETSTIRPQADPSDPILDSISLTPGYSTAEDYYLAARKRVGLAENSILATQCYFLFGVYEMYTLRPLRAWTSFNRACVLFQTSIGTRSKHQFQHFCASANLKHRLYWSCLKSEHEFRIEVRLPPSGIAKLRYSESFPSPPHGSPAPQSASDNLYSEFQSSRVPNASEAEHDKSWYYYLAEIAARRIMIRVISSFYNMDEREWLRIPIHKMIRVASELESQLLVWDDHLPQPVAFQQDGHAADELAFHLQARCAEIRERIYRPFLYVALELPSESPVQQAIEVNVQKHVAACSKLAHQWAVRHRHHGAWFGTRQALVSGLMLLAAAKSRGAVHVPRALLRTAIGRVTATLQYWEREAPDLRMWRMIMQSLFEEVESGWA